MACIYLVQVYAQDTIYQVNYSNVLSTYSGGIFKDNYNNSLVYSRFEVITPNFFCCNYPVLFRFNSNAILQWQKKYIIDSSVVFISSINQLNSSTFLIGAARAEVYHNKSSNMLFTIDSNGMVLNSWRYFNLSNNIPFRPSVTRLSNNFYVTGAGYVNSTASPSPLIIYKLDSLYQPVWGYEYDNGGYAINIEIQPVLTGDGIIITGNYADSASNANYGIMLKLDTAGNLQWSYKYEGGELTSFDDIKPLQDGGFIIAGSSTDPGQYTGLLVKIDAMGNIIWSHEYSMDGFCNSVGLTNDGGFIISGLSIDLGSDLTFLLKTDSLGNPDWMHFSTSGGHSVGAEQTADDGYLYVDGGGFNMINEIHIVKTDSGGNMGCYDVPYMVTSHPSLVRTPISFTRVPWQVTMSIANVVVDTTPLPDSVLCAGVSGIATHNKHKQTLEIFPNPSNSFCKMSALTFVNATLTLYDVTGRILLKKDFEEKLEVNIASFNAGIYFIEVKDKRGRSAKGKLMKE